MADGIGDNRADAKNIRVQRLPFFWDEIQDQDDLANLTNEDDICSPLRGLSAVRSSPVLYPHFGYETCVRYALPVLVDQNGACFDFLRPKGMIRRRNRVLGI